MGSLAKHSVRLKLEAYYGAGEAVAGTDGFLVATPPRFVHGMQKDGVREGRSAGGFTQLSRMPAQGAFVEVPLEFYFRGPGVAYSASVFSTLHRVLRALGFAGAVDVTVGAEKWTYTASSVGTDGGSLTGDVGYGNELVPFKGGVISSLEVGSKGKDIPLFKAKLHAIATDNVSTQSDAYIASLVSSYPYIDKDSPRSVGINLTLTNGATAFLGAWAEWTLKIERQVIERTNDNAVATYHEGFGLGPWTIRLSGVLDTVSRSPAWGATTFDPAIAFANATKFQVAHKIGVSDYEKWTIGTAGQTAQFAKMPELLDKDETFSRWGVEVQFNPANDASDIDFLMTTPRT